MKNTTIYKLRIVIYLILFLLITNIISAQKIRIQGTVKDITTNEGLMGVSIVHDGIHLPLYFFVCLVLQFPVHCMTYACKQYVYELKIIWRLKSSTVFHLHFVCFTAEKMFSEWTNTKQQDTTTCLLRAWEKCKCAREWEEGGWERERDRETENNR